MQHHATGIVIAAIAVVGAGLAAAAVAQSPTASAPAGAVGDRPGEGGPVPAASAPVGKDAAKPAAGKDDGETLPSAPDSGKPSPQRFEPTEKVRPDFDVAFPVDI